MFVGRRGRYDDASPPRSAARESDIDAKRQNARPVTIAVLIVTTIIGGFPACGGSGGSANAVRPVGRPASLGWKRRRHQRCGASGARPKAGAARRFIIAGFAAAALGLSCADAGAAQETVPTASLEIARPTGDVYNERTTDGDAYPQSLGIRGRWARGRYAIVLDYRRNVYQTETRGAGSLTRYARIEGGTGTVLPFLARESSFEARIERTAGHGSFAAGIGVLRTWTNYNYPSLTGLGIGLEHSPGARTGVRPFGSAFYYPSASGSYTTEAFPSRTAAPAFRILRLDYGVVVQRARTGLYVVAGYANEFRRGNGLPPENRLIRSDPYVAIGLRSL